ncbi:MAG: hypothetical protein NXI24_24090 [bacterium]|nr:hypothetical protein [bacterium]
MQSMAQSGRVVGIFLLAATLLLALSAPAGAETRRDMRGDESIDYWTRYGQVQLEFDRVRFRLGEDIPLKFRVRNVGYQVIRIYPSSRPISTYRFLVTDRQGRELPVRFNARSYNAREHGTRTVVDLQGDLTKEVILHPGETFEKTFYLNDFYELKPGAEYRVSAYFFPDQRFEYFVRSGDMSRIRIDSRKSAPAPLLRDDEPGSAGRPQISPEETIFLFLSAEMRQNWKNYLKYLELPRYITAYDRYASRYVQSGSQQRAEVLREFATYLTGNPADRLVRFKVTGVEPERDSAGRIIADGRSFVKVLGVRDSDGFVLQYEYTYTLEPGRDEDRGFWKIVYVEARLIR